MASCRGRRRGAYRRPTRDPVTAMCNAPQNTDAVSSARNAPNGWVAKEAMRLPLAACENEVVMPQVGQGRSRTAAHVQGIMPSCSCVPCPRADGVSMAAIVRTDKAPIAHAPATRRVLKSARADMCGAWVEGGAGATASVKSEHTLAPRIDIRNDGGE